jgi:hypothetical protein
MFKDCEMQLAMESNYLGKELGSFQLLCAVFVLISMSTGGELEEAMRLVSTFLKRKMDGRMFLTLHKVGK